MSAPRLESFHDCHVHGLRWRRDEFTFSLDLQYILEWIAPPDGVGSYQFRVVESRLTFHNASDVQLSIDWSRAALDLEIAELRAMESRPTPNQQMIERKFEFEFSSPDAVLSLWSTGFELVLLGEPVLSRFQSIPLAD